MGHGSSDVQQSCILALKSAECNFVANYSRLFFRLVGRAFSAGAPDIQIHELDTEIRGKRLVYLWLDIAEAIDFAAMQAFKMRMAVDIFMRGLKTPYPVITGDGMGQPLLNQPFKNTVNRDPVKLVFRCKSAGYFRVTQCVLGLHQNRKDRHSCGSRTLSFSHQRFACFIHRLILA